MIQLHAVTLNDEGIFTEKKRGEITNEIGKTEEPSLENKMVSYRLRYVQNTHT